MRNYIQHKIKKRWEFGWFLDCLWEAFLGITFACVLSLYEIFNDPQIKAF